MDCKDYFRNNYSLYIISYFRNISIKKGNINMRAIVILIDTLRKDFLSTYNKNSWAITPELDNFSKDSLTFDNHYIGSAPCMPARRDIFTGRLNFLERSWGPIELIDITFPKLLQKNDAFTHID